MTTATTTTTTTTSYAATTSTTTETAAATQFVVSAFYESCATACARHTAPAASAGAELINSTLRLQHVLSLVNESFAEVCAGGVTGSTNIFTPIIGKHQK